MTAKTTVGLCAAAALLCLAATLSAFGGSSFTSPAGGGGEPGIEGGGATTNLEASDVRYEIKSILPSATATERTWAYCKQVHVAGVDTFDYCLYFEIPPEQTLTGGSAIKIMHKGAGDALYVALIETGQGFGMESAIFGDSQTGFLGTWQGQGGFTNSVEQQPYSIGMHLLLGDDGVSIPFVPVYGMLLLNNSTGNAWTIRRSTNANVTQAQARVVAQDYTATWELLGNGDEVLRGASGSPTHSPSDSAATRWRASYWDGAQEVFAGGHMLADIDAASAPAVHVYVGATGTESHIAKFDANGLTINSVSPSASHALCVTSAGAIGVCSDQPDGSGECTCN